ncbi:MAG: V-type ATP synthase subunit E [Parachlamydiales bacterium]|nr:V-type ATP synthase subunit E [Parachlamydiales bacterium]
MQELKGKDKIQKICDLIRNETVDPAKQQAKEILENAQLQKDKIIEDAKKEAQKIIQEAKVVMEKHKNVVETSLHLACQQVLGDLKQKIMNRFLNENILEVLQPELSKVNIVAKLINGVVEAIEKEGLDTDINIYISRTVSQKEVQQLLVQNVLARLQQGKILIGDFVSGVKVQLIENKVTIDISDEALQEMITQYIRKDFQELIFKL